MSSSRNYGLERMENDIRRYLKTKDKETVIALYLQVLWERDLAVSQLHQLGYHRGEEAKQDIEDEPFSGKSTSEVLDEK